MSTFFHMHERFGAFLADGEVGNVFRMAEVEPALSRGEHVILDFEGVTNMTDSFCNACFANLVANHPETLSGQIEFRSCSPTIKQFLTFAIALGKRLAKGEATAG